MDWDRFPPTDANPLRSPSSATTGKSLPALLTAQLARPRRWIACSTEAFAMGALRKWVGTAASFLIASVILSQTALGQAPEPRPSLLDFMEKRPTLPEPIMPG